MLAHWKSRRLIHLGFDFYTSPTHAHFIKELCRPFQWHLWKTQDLLAAPLSLGIETARGVWSPNWKNCKAFMRLPKIFWKMLFNPNTSHFGTSLLWRCLWVNLSFYEYLFVVEATMLGESLSSLAVFNLILFVEVFIFQAQDGTSMGPLQMPKIILTWAVNHHSLSTRSWRSTQLPASEFFSETFGNPCTLSNPNASCFENILNSVLRSRQIDWCQNAWLLPQAKQCRCYPFRRTEFSHLLLPHRRRIAWGEATLTPTW